jgi:hypothetical protein
MLRWFESETLPDSVKILGVTWAVASTSVHAAAEAKYRGSATHGDQEIWVDADLKPDTKWRVYFHEVLHTISQALNLELTEHEVLVLEAALPCFFQENHITIEQPGEPDAT